jgi:hypothetical protein
MPTAFLFSWPAWICLAVHGHEGLWIIAIVWGLMVVHLIIESRLIKVVTIDGDHFIISDGFTQHHVPIAHLASVTVRSYRGSQTLFIEFDPPTPFGKRVCIVTPVEFFSHEYFDKVVAFLRSLIRNREEL